MITEKEKGENQCLPDLIGLLNKCLDHVNAVCGEKNGERAAVQKTQYGKLGKEEFRRCVGYVWNLPHIQDLVEHNDFQLNIEFAEIIFWGLKLKIISIVWGELLTSLYSLPFKKVDKEKTSCNHFGLTAMHQLKASEEQSLILI